MIKTFTGFGSSTGDTYRNKNMRVENIQFDTNKRLLSFNTVGTELYGGVTSPADYQIYAETLDGNRIASFKPNSSISITLSQSNIRLVLKNQDDTKSQALDLTSAPIISDMDRNLGDKNTAFIVTYQVNDSDNDTLTVIEKLNGNVLRTLNNAPRGQDLNINISSQQLYALPLNQENKITIEVSDGKYDVSYRNYTFRRTNTAPIISNTDKNLGIITALTEKYTINDMEGNAVTIVEKLDNVVLRNFAAGLGNEYATTIDKDTWIKLKNGQHTYSIEATDSNNSKSTRVFSFTKKENKIDFTLAKPFSTDIKASKILVTPSWELNGATAKVEVCNNAFDANPTWEDITKQVLINRHYNFTNTAKTADKWGINIRIYIEKDAASLADVSIKGFGGAFE